MNDPVVIVFTTSTSTIGKAIRWITHSQVSHCMIEFLDPVLGGEWIVEATAGGVRAVPAWKSRVNVVEEYECQFDGYKVLPLLAPYVGQNYDYVGLLGLGWWLLFNRWLRIKIRYPLHDSAAQKCSELIAIFFKWANLRGTENWFPELVTPEQLRRFCDQHAEYFARRMG